MTGVRLTTVAVALCGALGVVAPAMASAASISGTVKAEGGGAIQGVEVCPRPEPYAFETSCTETSASGGYRLDGLPAASYYLTFSTSRNNLNYVPESYNDKPTSVGSGELLTLGAGTELTGIDAELKEGGVIVGTLTNAETAGPAANVVICVSSFNPTEYSRCASSGPDGGYEVNALPPGEYAVWFNGENEANYLAEYYDDVGSSGLSTRIPIVSGATVTGIDAALDPGAQILGRVTEAGTEAPLDEIEVCLYELHSSHPEYSDRCARTDAAGVYAIRSLRENTFNVVFSEEPGAGFMFDDTFVEQWWNGVPSAAQATPVHVAPALSVTGIDAHLTNMVQRPKPEGIQVTFFPTPPSRALKCRKGFHKKKVKSKVRCVKKHKKRHHRHGHGPHAVATAR
jgi:hypothetical protein